MRQAGLHPDTDLKYRHTGSHPATAKAAESGAADAGALRGKNFVRANNQEYTILRMIAQDLKLL